MPVRQLKEFLDRNDIKYVSISHSPAFTAQEIAANAHVPGQELAKTVVVKLDNELSLAVLPASYQIDLDLLRTAADAETVELASEDEFRDRFPGCEVGAMPPIGSLYEMRTFVSGSLAEDETIAFNAGTHSELIRMSYRDFEKVTQPTVLHFAAHAV